MRFLRCVHAEFLLVFPRLTRTRLGVSLLAAGFTLVWLQRHGLDSLTVVLQAAALGAIVAAAGVVGHESDRGTLTTALTHPTTALAVATGRWLAIALPGAALAIVCATATGSDSGSIAAGVVSAAAVGGFALAVVVPGGKPAALSLFLFMAIAGTVPPERLVDLARPGVLRLAAAGAIELGPALWHYRDIALGDRGGGAGGALLHATAWTGLGILLASACIARRRPH